MGVLKDYKQGLLKQFGQLESGETAGEEDFVIADFVSGEQKIEGAYVALRSMSDEIKKDFVGLKKGDVKEVDIVRSFPMKPTVPPCSMWRKKNSIRSRPSGR